MNEIEDFRNTAWTSSEFCSRKSGGTGRFLTQVRNKQSGVSVGGRKAEVLQT